MASYRSIISAISENISTVVHIGAGYCTEYPLYKDLGVKQIVFVESDKQLSDIADDKFSHTPDITVLNRTIGEQNGVGQFFQTSNRRFSSLLKPNQILKYYPNLSVTNEHSVDTITIESLFNEIQLLETDQNLLILEMQGAELSTISVTNAEVLQQFKWIIVRTGMKDLYGPMSTDTESEIKGLLHNRNFDSLSFEEDTPPFTKCLFIRNDLALDNKILKTKAEAFLTDFQALNADHSELQNQNSELVSENTLLNQQNAALVDKLSEARAAQEKWATEHQAKIEQLTDERDHQAKLATERKTQLENSSQISADLEKLATERQTQIEQLSGERDEQTKLAAERKAQLENASQVSADLENLSTERQARIEQLTRERDEQAKLATDRKAQLENSSQVSADLEKLAEERQGRIEQLTRERDEQVKIATDRKAQLENTSQVSADLEKLATERQARIEQLTRERDEQAKLATDRKAQLENSSQVSAEFEKLATERRLALEELRKEESDKTSQMLDLVKKQQDNLDRMEKGIVTHLTKGMANTTRQIEAFIGIDTYLSRGEMLPALHGWPVSADFALYLIGLIEKNNYDLILEFGSGASTVLMANALQKQIQRQRVQSTHDENSDRKLTYNREFGDAHQNVTSTLPDKVVRHDLLPRIVTFEHHRKYFEATQEMLNQSKVRGLVELVYSPLRDYKAANGDSFLYYSCEEVISNLGSMLDGHRAKVLLLVDGPPAVTGEHARYPALPIALQSLPNHRIDVLLDDYNRQEEKDVVERWVELLNKRSIVHEQHELEFEKGACLLSVT